MHAYFIGICGTAMGSAAIALQREGWRVSGSDRAFYAPMSDALRDAGVDSKQGWAGENITSDVDLVIVGNVCRADNPEVLAASRLQVRTTSLPALIAEEFIGSRECIAVCGTHGKSTSTALLAWMLQDNGVEPGYMVAAKAANFAQSMKRGGSDRPFVIEADEYDTAYFEKTPKFWHYNARHALWTSVEFDHADIYPNEAAYVAAFAGMQSRLPDDGSFVAYAGDPNVRALLANVPQRIIWYAVEGDPVGDVVPTWTAAPTANVSVSQPRGKLALAPQRLRPLQAFDLFTAGSYCGRVSSPLLGVHNLRNTLACLAMATEVCGVSMEGAFASLSTFAGLARRQQALGTFRGIDFFDDFAHHPTAVAETLKAFRNYFPDRRLVAVFEPRSATACRAVHQQAYVSAFSAADVVCLAPVGRAEVGESLDTSKLTRELSRSAAITAFATDSLQNLKVLLLHELRERDIVVFMSNGRFGDVRETVMRGR